MDTIAKIIDKLQKSGGSINCSVECEYYEEDTAITYFFNAETARIHPNSNNCVDFEGEGFYISSNNLENEQDAIEQLWEQIK